MAPTGAAGADGAGAGARTEGGGAGGAAGEVALSSKPKTPKRAPINRRFIASRYAGRLGNLPAAGSAQANSVATNAATSGELKVRARAVRAEPQNKKHFDLAALGLSIPGAISGK